MFIISFVIFVWLPIKCVWQDVFLTRFTEVWISLWAESMPGLCEKTSKTIDMLLIIIYDMNEGEVDVVRLALQDIQIRVTSVLRPV